MFSLVISTGSLVLHEVALDRDRYTIGRRPHNDIHLDHLTVSGEHALIKRLPDPEPGAEWLIEDRASTNGTAVNRERVHRHVLKTNDLIEIGVYKLKFVRSDASVGKVAGPELGHSQLELATINVDMLPPSGGLDAPPTGMQTATQARLQVLNGPDAGQWMPLDRSVISIGTTGLQVAVIARRKDRYYITHLEGAEFPRVNGVRIGLVAHGLTHQDVIEVAGVQVRFHTA